MKWDFYRQTKWVLISFICLQCMISFNAFASFHIDKIRAFLSLDRPVDAITLTNLDKAAPVNLQVQTLKWSQEKQQDTYQPTKDLIIVPPVISIPPTRNQILRIGWRTPSPLDQELTYRVFIQELTKPQSKSRKQSGIVSMIVRLGVPVFIEPITPRYQFNWQASRAPNNQLKIVLQNKGNVHIQVSKIDLLNEQNQLIAHFEKPFYVLAQQEKEVLIPLSGHAGNSVTISATTDHQPLLTTTKIS